GLGSVPTGKVDGRGIEVEAVNGQARVRLRHRDRRPAGATRDVGTCAGGSARSRAWTSGIPGRCSAPKDCSNHGRLKSPWASTASCPYAVFDTPPPVRNASWSWGMTVAHATIERAIGAME